MYISHVLLKFISKREYVEDFLNGDFYMNTLYTFWKQKSLEEAKRKREAYIKAHPEENPDDIKIKMPQNLSGGQSDTLESVVGYGSNARFKPMFGEHILSDCIYQAVGFQYCNVLCFYRLDFYTPSYRLEYMCDNNLLLHYDPPNMEEFGEYVIIIKDKQEFLRRISRAIGEMKYLCGDIEYKPLMRNGMKVDISDRHHILVQQEPVANILEIQTENGDCFSKFDKYSLQREWRLAIYRGEKDTSAFTFHVGNLRDITYCTKAENLIPELDKLLIAGEIRPRKDRHYLYCGNITRLEMRKKFYQLGDNKANLFLFIG